MVLWSLRRPIDVALSFYVGFSTKHASLRHLCTTTQRLAEAAARHQCHWAYVDVEWLRTKQGSPCFNPIIKASPCSTGNVPNRYVGIKKSVAGNPLFSDISRI